MAQEGAKTAIALTGIGGVISVAAAILTPFAGAIAGAVMVWGATAATMGWGAGLVLSAAGFLGGGILGRIAAPFVAIGGIAGAAAVGGVIGLGVAGIRSVGNFVSQTASNFATTIKSIFDPKEKAPKSETVKKPAAEKQSKLAEVSVKISFTEAKKDKPAANDAADAAPTQKRGGPAI